MKLTRTRRGISYVMEVVMMTLVITALSTVVLTWGLNAISDSKAAMNSAVNARMSRIQEGVLVEDVQMLSPTSLRIWVRNVGSVQIVVDQVYISNVNVPVTGACPPGTVPAPNCPSGTKLSLAVQSVGAVEITAVPPSVSGTPSSGAPACGSPPICSQYSYVISVATTRGTTFQGSFTV